MRAKGRADSLEKQWSCLGTLFTVAARELAKSATRGSVDAQGLQLMSTK